jgi:hypothetical protein
MVVVIDRIEKPTRIEDRFCDAYFDETLKDRDGSKPLRDRRLALTL